MFAIMEAERMDAFNSSIKVINACERHPPKTKRLIFAQRAAEAPSESSPPPA